MEMATDIDDTLQPTVLTQRLDRRRTEAPGIIDVRQPRNIYSRTAGWIAQRFALLDDLKFRYSGDDNPPEQSSGLVFATAPAQPPTETSSAFPAATQFSRAPEKPLSSPASFVSPVASLPAGKFRLSRRATPLHSESHALDAPSAKPRAASSLPTEAETKPDGLEVIARPNQEHRELAAAEISPLPTGAIQSSSSMILPKSHQSNDERSLVTPETAAGNAESSRYVDSLPLLSKAISTPLSEQRSRAPVNVGTLPAKILRKSPQPGKSVSEITSSTDLLLHKSSSGPNETSTALASSDAVGTSAENAEAVPSHVQLPSSLAPAKPQLATMAFQRQQEGANAEVLPSIKERAGTNYDYRTAVATEIRSDSTKPDMVWRKSANGSPAGDFMTTETNGDLNISLPWRIDSATRSTPVIARREAAPASPAAVPELPAGTEAVVPAETGATAPTGEMDLEQLTERVSRMIFRQLAVERERRGLGKWH
jgi:hypothetical protein